MIREASAPINRNPAVVGKTPLDESIYRFVGWNEWSIDQDLRPTLLEAFLKALQVFHAAAEIGPAGCWMLTSISIRQQELAGGGADFQWVHFSEGHLASLICGTVEDFRRCRDACYTAGWLDYRTDPQSGRTFYAVTVPKPYLMTLDSQRSATLRQDG